MKKFVTGMLAGAVMLGGISGAAQATTVYSVQSTSVVNCSGASHGLWTGQQNFYGGSCGNYYDISGIFTVNDNDANTDNWTGSFTAFAINPQGTEANINLTFSNFAETAKYKTEGGVSYDENTDTPDIDFFQDVAGSIEIDNITYTVDGFAGGYSFQWGQGGNAKDASEFGGSAWMLLSGPGGSLPGHWDLNLAFGAPVTTTEVPEPGALAVFGLGLLGLGLARRRQRKA